MKGDFSRDTFDKAKHFSRVLMQQGRVQLDADWNEQVSILLHYMQTLAMDIIGPYAGPKNDCGFKITAAHEGFSIGEGRYYVNGILCENSRNVSYRDQPDFPNPPDFDSKEPYVVYLDVWERHITFIEDDDIREKALGGPDTATRAQTVWQVKVKKLNYPYAYSYCMGGAWLLDSEIAISKACLRARAKMEQKQLEPCITELESGYRGLENQLYRIEVHRGGLAWDGSIDAKGTNAAFAATFKWSRDNGTIVFPIVRRAGNVVTVASLGKDDRTRLKPGDWVEIMDDDHELAGEPGIMAEVDSIDPVEMSVVLKPLNAGSSGNGNDEKSGKHPLLRRWDHGPKEGISFSEGAILISEISDTDSDWIEIENGIQLQFQQGGTYRTGDYWLIPARAATGDVEWPHDKFQPPQGIMHHFAPLAIISSGGPTDCRCKFEPLSHDCYYSYYGQLGAGIGVDLLCTEQ